MAEFEEVVNIKVVFDGLDAAVKQLIETLSKAIDKVSEHSDKIVPSDSKFIKLNESINKLSVSFDNLSKTLTTKFANPMLQALQAINKYVVEIGETAANAVSGVSRAAAGMSEYGVGDKRKTTGGKYGSRKTGPQAPADVYSSIDRVDYALDQINKQNQATNEVDLEIVKRRMGLEKDLADNRKNIDTESTDTEVERVKLLERQKIIKEQLLELDRRVTDSDASVAEAKRVKLLEEQRRIKEQLLELDRRVTDSDASVAEAERVKLLERQKIIKEQLLELDRRVTDSDASVAEAKRVKLLEEQRRIKEQLLELDRRVTDSDASVAEAERVKLLERQKIIKEQLLELDRRVTDSDASVAEAKRVKLLEEQRRIKEQLLELDRRVTDSDASVAEAERVKLLERQKIIKEQLLELDRRVTDSDASVAEAKRVKLLEEQRRIKEQLLELDRRVTDSDASVAEAERVKLLERQKIIKEQLLELDRRVTDSDASVAEAKRVKLLEEQRRIKEQLLELDRRVTDSDASVAEAERVKLLERQKIIKEQLLELDRRVTDSDASVAEAKRVKLLEEQRRIKEQLLELDRRVTDSDASVAEAERVKLLERQKIIKEQLLELDRRVTDSDASVAEAKRVKLLEEQRRIKEQLLELDRRVTDSDASVAEAERVKLLERQKIIKEQLLELDRRVTDSDASVAEAKRVKLLEEQRRIKEQLLELDRDGANAVAQKAEAERYRLIEVAQKKELVAQGNRAETLKKAIFDENILYKEASKARELLVKARAEQEVLIEQGASKKIIELQGQKIAAAEKYNKKVLDLAIEAHKYTDRISRGEGEVAFEERPPQQRALMAGQRGEVSESLNLLRKAGKEVNAEIKREMTAREKLIEEAITQENALYKQAGENQVLIRQTNKSRLDLINKGADAEEIKREEAKLAILKEYQIKILELAELTAKRRREIEAGGKAPVVPAVGSHGFAVTPTQETVVPTEGLEGTIKTVTKEAEALLNTYQNLNKKTVASTKDASAERLAAIEKTTIEIGVLEKNLANALILVNKARTEKEVLQEKGASRQILEIADKKVRAIEGYYNRLVEAARLSAEKRSSLERGTGSISTPQEQINLGAFNSQIREANKQASGALNNFYRMGEQLDVLNKRGSIFNRIIRSWSTNAVEMMAKIIEFQVGWGIAQAGIDAVLFPFRLIVNAIKESVTYLKDMQERVTDIREVLLQNAKFSDDVEKNFILAGKAAEVMADKQIELSAKTGIPFDKLQNVFESFAQSGGLKAVGNDLEKAADSAALLVVGLGSVGVSTKDVRRATLEIRRLLDGTVTSQTKMVQLFKISAAELNKQSKEHQKIGDFNEWLDSLLKAQNIRLDTATERLSSLMALYELMRNRIAAAFSSRLIKEWMDLFKDLLAYLRKNQDALSAYARNWAEQLIVVFNLLVSIKNILGGTAGGILGIIGSIVKLVDMLAVSLLKITHLVDGGGPEISLYEKIAGGIAATIGGISIIINALGTYLKLMGSFLTRVTDPSKWKSLTTPTTDTKIGQAMEEQQRISDEYDVSIQKKAVALANLRATYNKAIAEGAKEIVVGHEGGFNITKTLAEFKSEIDKEQQTINELSVSRAKQQNSVRAALTGTTIEYEENTAQIKQLEETISKLQSEYDTATRGRLLALEAKKRADELAYKAEAELSSFKSRVTSDANKILAKQKEVTDLTRKVTVGKTGGEQFTAEVKLANSLKELEVLKQNQITKAQVEAQQERYSLAKDEAKKMDLLAKKAAEDIKELPPTVDRPYSRNIRDIEREIEFNTAKVIELQKKSRKKITDNRIIGEAQSFALEVKLAKQDYNEFAAKVREQTLQSTFLRKPEEKEAPLFEGAGNVSEEVLKGSVLQDLLARLRTALKELQNTKNEIIRTYDAMVSAGEMTQVEATRRSIEILKWQQSMASRLTDQIVKEATVLYPKLKTEVVSKFKIAITGIRNAIKNEETLGEIDANKKQQAEINRIEANIYRERLSRIVSFKRSELEIYKTETNRGLHTKADLVIKEIELEQMARMEEEEEFKRRENEVGVNEEKLAQIDEDRITARMKFNDKIAALRAAYLTAEQEENDKILKLRADRKKIEAEGLKVQADIMERGGLHPQEAAELRVKATKKEVEYLEFLIKEQTKLGEIEDKTAAGKLKRSNDILILQNQILEAEQAAAEAKVMAPRSETNPTGRGAFEIFSGLSASEIISGRQSKDLDKALFITKEFRGAFEYFYQAGMRIVQAFKSGNTGEGISAIGGVVGNLGENIAKIGGKFASKFGEALQVIGPWGEIAGMVVSMISALWGRAARKISAQMKKDFDDILTNFNNQITTLGETVFQLQQKRMEAIIKLSGKKGGQAELDKLLPDFDQQIADLIRQQKDVQKTFQNELRTLRLGSGSLADFATKWDDILKKVKEYKDSFSAADLAIVPQASIQAMMDKLGKPGDTTADTAYGRLYLAGQESASMSGRFTDPIMRTTHETDLIKDYSDAVEGAQREVDDLTGAINKANTALDVQGDTAEFVSRSLKNLKTGFMEELNSGEQEAIQNALDLNDLIKQRTDLIQEGIDAQKAFNKEVFDLINADAIERRQSGAVSRALEVKTATEQYNKDKKAREEQLSDLNRQINLKAKMVEMESKIFNLTGSIGDLKDRQDTSTLANLDIQISKWLEIQDIVAGIYQVDPTNPDSLWAITDKLLKQISAGSLVGGNNYTNNIGSVTVNMSITGVDVTSGKQIGTDASNAFISNVYRYGTTSGV